MLSLANNCVKIEELKSYFLLLISSIIISISFSSFKKKRQSDNAEKRTNQDDETCLSKNKKWEQKEGKMDEHKEEL